MPMRKLPSDLSNATILLSNDDGIRSPGLEALEEIARSISHDVWVVAPENEQSAASHSLTISRPIRVRQISEKRFAVDGTPTDCVLMAINLLMKDNPPDLVLSGINRGENIGDDVTYSGTIAAAMEATLLGVPAMALSQAVNGWEVPKWAVAKRYGPEVIRKAVQCQWGDNVLVNINFPALEEASEVNGIHVVPHGKHKIGDNLVERIDPRGQTYYWVGLLRGLTHAPEHTDIAIIEKGGITVTPLSLDLNHDETRSQLEQVFS